MLNHPYKVWWYAIPILLLLSALGPGRSIDIQWHDTYFIITSLSFSILFSIMAGVFGIMYWAFRNRKLSKWMTLFHLIINLMSFIGVILLSLFYFELMGRNRSSFYIIQKTILIFLALNVCSQFVFILNLVLSLRKNS